MCACVVVVGAPVVVFVLVEGRRQKSSRVQQTVTGLVRVRFGVWVWVRGGKGRRCIGAKEKQNQAAGGPQALYNSATSSLLPVYLSLSLSLSLSFPLFPARLRLSKQENHVLHQQNLLLAQLR